MAEVQVERFAPFFMLTENRIFLMLVLPNFTKKRYENS